jgi:hypothetical protein
MPKPQRRITQRKAKLTTRKKIVMPEKQRHEIIAKRLAALINERKMRTAPIAHWKESFVALI